MPFPLKISYLVNCKQFMIYSIVNSSRKPSNFKRNSDRREFSGNVPSDRGRFGRVCNMAHKRFG